MINKKFINKNAKVGVKFHGYEMFQHAPNFKTKLQFCMLRPFVKFLNINADFVFSYGGKITNIKNLGIPKRKIIEIPSGISQKWLIKDLNFNKNSPLKFLFIGRNERRKGYKN